MYRNNTCGELGKNDVGSKVYLAGWVARVRDLGGLVFVDLRDRYGKTQVVFDPGTNPELAAEAKKLRAEWVVRLGGKVQPRPENMVNRDMNTGEIEVEGSEIDNTLKLGGLQAVSVHTWYFISTRAEISESSRAVSRTVTGILMLMLPSKRSYSPNPARSLRTTGGNRVSPARKSFA